MTYDLKKFSDIPLDKERFLEILDDFDGFDHITSWSRK